MNPRIRLRRPASIGSNQASPANSPCSAAALLLSLSMAWSPPALERRSWLVTQAGDYATQISHHTRDGTCAAALFKSGVVEHEDDAALAACAGLARKGGEQFGKEGLREAAA